MTGRMIGALLLGTLLAAPAPAGAQAVDPAPIVTRGSREFRALSGISAAFRQQISDKVLGDEESRGEFFQAGNRYLFRWTDPAGSFILFDGNRVHSFNAKDAPTIVMRLSPPTGPAYNLNIIDWLMKSPLERYRLTFVKTETVGGQICDAVLLEPTVRTPDLPFRRVTLWFARSDGLPRRILTDEGPLKRTVDLTNLRPNAPIPAGTFAFRQPPGTKVIDQ